MARSGAALGFALTGLLGGLNKGLRAKSARDQANKVFEQQKKVQDEQLKIQQDRAKREAQTAQKQAKIQGDILNILAKQQGLDVERGDQGFALLPQRSEGQKGAEALSANIFPDGPPDTGMLSGLVGGILPEAPEPILETATPEGAIFALSQKPPKEERDLAIEKLESRVGAEMDTIIGIEATQAQLSGDVVAEAEGGEKEGARQQRAEEEEKKIDAWNRLWSTINAGVKRLLAKQASNEDIALWIESQGLDPDKYAEWKKSKGR